MFYLCSENKGADQLCSYHTVDLRLVLASAKSGFSHDVAQINAVCQMRHMRTTAPFL